MEWMAMPWVAGVGFLPIYAWVLAALLALAVGLRWCLRAPGAGQPSGALGTYEAAYLAGGPDRALAAALGALLESETLAFENTPAWSLRRTRLSGAVAPGAPPLERALATRGGGALWDRDLRASLRALPEVHALRERLEADELLLSRDEARRARLWPLLVMSLGVPFGIPRLARGLSHHRPSGFLILMIAAAALATLAFARRAFRSRRGDTALDDWRRRADADEAPLSDAALIASAGAGAVIAVGAAFAEPAAARERWRGNWGSVADSSCGVFCGDGGGGGCGGGGGGCGGGGGGDGGGGGCGGCGGGGS
jgi:uncharacterized protein (TIGR04222 family)